MKEARCRAGGGLRSWVDRPDELEVYKGQSELGLRLALGQLNRVLAAIEGQCREADANGMPPSAAEFQAQAIACGKREAILAEIAERRRERDAGRDSSEA